MWTGRQGLTECSLYTANSIALCTVCTKVYQLILIGKIGPKWARVTSQIDAKGDRSIVYIAQISVMPFQQEM